MSDQFKDNVDLNNSTRLEHLLESLPQFIRTYFRGKKNTTSTSTQVSYAYDFKLFFQYLSSEDDFRNIDWTATDISILDRIKVEHIDNYLYFLSSYENKNRNQAPGISRKISSLRSLYHFFYKRNNISTNPASIMDMPKIPDKAIIYLEPNEIADLLDSVENGNELTGRAKSFHKHTKERDLALFSLLLGTGIRISECVGLNLDNIDFNVNGIRITRKGGKESIIYFNDEVAEAMLQYLNIRNAIISVEGHEKALFLSLHKKRISVRSVQKLVKKYAQAIVKLKPITPHKLRSSFGTNLYHETGDIKLVSESLGHSNLTITSKYYSATTDDARRRASKKIRLR